MRRVRLAAAALAVLAAVLVLALAGRGTARLGPTPVGAQSAATVPRAECGPNDRTENALQGQTTIADRVSSASLEAYNCNLELVGQYAGEGASWQFAWFEDCGYYDTRNNAAVQMRGTIVIDASDPANPFPTANLTDRAMLDPWESLKVNKRRKLLGATKGPGGANDRQFSFYDIKHDCTQPQLLADVDVPGHIGHAGDFAPDGMTYYGTSLQGHFTAMDISDPTNPQPLLVTRLNQMEPVGRYVFHDIYVSEDGTRLYGANFGRVTNRPNGLVILDVSDIQYRRPDPQLRVVGEHFWDDGSQAAQVGQPIRIRGKPYILFADEGGGRAGACAVGKSPYGMARIIDISDETQPFTVSRLMLEVDDPANCALTLTDNVGNGGFQYDSHYCTVDNPHNARVAGCGHFAAGIRVFDIRDPYHPKEIAYYKPPAPGTTIRPASQHSANPGNRTTDWASANVRFVNYRGEDHLWTTSQDGGFLILRFTKKLNLLLRDSKDHRNDP